MYAGKREIDSNYLLNPFRNIIIYSIKNTLNYIYFVVTDITLICHNLWPHTNLYLVILKILII